MDYDQFLKELRAVYSENGFEMEYASYNGRYSVKQETYIPKKKEQTFTWNKNPMNISNDWMGKSYNNNKNYDKSFKMFESIAEVVYYFAFRLSSLIGKLPEALHVRMVMSTDDNWHRKEYVRIHGC